MKQDQNVEFVLSEIDNMLEETGYWLTLEGFGEEFVTYFFRHARDETLTIDEDLNYLRRRLGEHEY